MSSLTDNGMDHLLYPPKQYLMPCQSQQLSKMRHIQSHSRLDYNWRTKAATDDLHHHCSMQVKRDDHTLRPIWKQRYTQQKQKSGHHFIYPEDCNTQRQMNTQSGFNAEQIEKDNYPESKTI
jgi:hypothetical protein